jgi:CreA protein
MAARGAHATGEPDRRFQKNGALRTPWLMGTKGGAIMNVEAEWPILRTFNFCLGFYKGSDVRNGGQAMNRLLFRYSVIVLMTALLDPHAPARAADEPDLIFKRSTVFKWLTPNDKLATYGLDDPEVEGVACHFTVPEKGGFKGWVGVAEEVSDISLACRQIGPIRIKAKFEQGEDVFRKRRSLFFKKMQIVRGCDVQRNVLVYMVYSDRIIEGSPKNSTSTVPIMPWGASDQVQRCADFVEH